MLIRELEKNTGMERATIRFYEKEGLITPIRHENGYREYSQDDCDTLLKVKLLRQLGMPLEMIRGLQQGSEDFSTALTDQIHMLEHQIEDAGRAKEVCLELRDAGATYEALDAAHYLHELTRVRPAEPAWTPEPVPEFRQKVPTHPWRRYFARRIDNMIASSLIMFLTVVVLRIRPLNNFIYYILSLLIVNYMLWIPIEGLLLHYLGTTPGKWIMGIRVESINGGKLSISDAMHRAWDVLRYGYGFTIPIFYLWRMYRSRKDYVNDGFTCWDCDWAAEVQFSDDYETKKKVMIGALAVVYMLVSGLLLNESVLPAHRGENLTIAQISENYNDYLETIYGDEMSSSAIATMRLKENGQWQSGFLIMIGRVVDDAYSDYEYELEDGYVRSIIYDQSWTHINTLTPVGPGPLLTIISIAGAQDWMNLPRFYEFADQLQTALKQQEEGRYIYENLEIHWNCESENCIFSTNGTYYTDNEAEPSSVHLHLEIEIHKTK